MNVPGFEPADAVTSIEHIDGAEKLLGVRFPQLYRDILVSHSGAYGDAEFPLGNSVGGIGVWLSINPRDPESVWSCLGSWREHDLPSWLVPFGEDGGGNYVCFDFRTPSEPSIKTWFHELAGEEGLFPIAESFNEFFKLLRAGA